MGSHRDAHGEMITHRESGQARKDRFPSLTPAALAEIFVSTSAYEVLNREIPPYSIRGSPF